MKKSILYLLFLYFLVSASGLQAQTKTLIDEQFNKDTGSWQTFNGSYYSAEVAGGKYVLECKKEYYKNFYKYFYVDPKKDFYMKMQMTMVSQGEKNYGCGLVWGSSYMKQYYFSISKTGYFIIYKYDGYVKKTTNIKDWTTSDLINDLGEANVLAIEKKGNTLSFLINGVTVFDMPFKTFFGSNLGVAVASNTKVAIDYFVVRSTKKDISLIDNPNQGFEKESLGTNVNSSTSELHPIISQDGKTLYFTRDGHAQNTGAKKLQDVWFSKIQSDGSWGKAQNIGSPINDQGHNSGLYLSPDNNTFLIDMDEGDEIGDKQGIYESHRTLSGWSKPVEIDIDNYYNYNKYESQCISADGNTLIMGIEREDTHGGTDLYVCYRKGTNSWSRPKNMGGVINTFGDDFTPFLAADGKTLYFASEGHPGYGSADIYVTKRLDDTWVNWSKPKNLGKEINTTGWDAYYSVAASGEDAFLISTGLAGSSDIFKIKLAEAAKPDPVVMISGKVYDADTKKPIAAKIIYEDLATGKRLGLARSNPKNGRYKIVLPYGKYYGLRAEAKNYIAISENINITEKKDYIEVKRDLYLAPIKIGQTIKLQNVFFKRGRPDLLDNSFPELDRLVKIMEENPKIEIELGGHTDGVGNPVVLLKLSEERVKTVVGYLIEHGVAQSRVVGKGYGGTKPVASNRAEETRKLNRRVEFKILKF